MSKPTYQQVHTDVPLTNVSIAYTNPVFIAEQVFPNVPVQNISGKYFIYTKADWLRREADVRAAGTRATRGDYGLSTSTYTCVEYAIAKGVPDEIVANADSPLRPFEMLPNGAPIRSCSKLRRSWRVRYSALAGRPARRPPCCGAMRHRRRSKMLRQVSILSSARLALNRQSA